MDPLEKYFKEMLEMQRESFQLEQVRVENERKMMTYFVQVLQNAAYPLQQQQSQQNDEQQEEEEEAGDAEASAPDDKGKASYEIVADESDEDLHDVVIIEEYNNGQGKEKQQDH